MQVTKHEQGRFCWADLNTTDSAAAKAFYQTLFGWDAIDSDMGGGMIYTTMTVNGSPVGALWQDNSGQAPPHWTVYVSVDDAEATAAKAAELGGTVTTPAFDVAEHGRMADITDPTGASFHIWQAKAHIGYGVINEPGAPCWHELITTDPSAAQAFYSGLLGYTAKPSEMPMPYFELQLEGNSVAGMMQMPEHTPGVPSHWQVYFFVKNCQETFDKGIELGAVEVVAPMAIPGVGTMAMLRDPQGAVFAFVG